MTYRHSALLTLVCVAFSGCTTIRPPTSQSEAGCGDGLARYAKIRPDALNLDEWADWHWSQFLKFNGRSLSDDIRSETISKADYVNSITHGQPTSPMMGESIDHGFDQASHGKGYIAWSDARQNEAADFARHDRNHDGWVTKEECAVTIILPSIG